MTSGEVFCAPGFMAKLERLKDFGCDLTELTWLSEARNTYLHDCTIYAGYTANPDADSERLILQRGAGDRPPGRDL